jgi:hypothetical protein
MINAGSFAQLKNVALIALSSDKKISTQEISATDVNLVMDLANKDKFDLEKTLEAFRIEFYDNLRKEFPFPILDHEKVVNNEKFKGLVADSQNGNFASLLASRISSPGYANYTLISKKLTPEFLNAFSADGVDAFMYVTLDYGFAAKLLIQGTGTCNIMATATMTIYNSKSKLIFIIKSQGTSDTAVKVAAGNVVAGSEKMPEMLKEASDKLFIDIKNDLPKRIKKMEKRLAKLSATEE